MEDGNSISARKADTVIHLKFPPQQIRAALGVNVQLVGKTVNDAQAHISCACVNKNYLNTLLPLIDEGLERCTEPTFSVMGRNDHG
jgi:hypothetical protein